MSGPRSDGLGNPLESATDAVTGVAGAIGDLSVEDILKTGVALSVALHRLTLIREVVYVKIFAFGWVFFGFGSTINGIGRAGA